MINKWIISFVLISVAAVFRYLFITLPCFAHVYYDEAVPGLMAMDMLDGKFTEFYWGAPYLGSLESIIAAIFFKLFAVDTLWLRMSPFVSSLFAAAGMMILSLKMNGNRFPFYTALFFTIPPLVFNEYSISPLGGYMQTIALGTWFLVLMLNALKKSESAFPAAELILAGLIAGVGFWTFMMILPFLAAGSLVFFVRIRSSYRLRALVLLCLTFCCGSLPWFSGNIQNGWLTFAMKGGFADISLFKQQFINFMHVSMMLFGWGAEFAKHFTEDIIKYLSSAVWIGAFVSFIMYPSFIHNNKQEAAAATLMLFSGLCFFASCFIFSMHGGEQLSRYGLPLYVFLGVPWLSFFERITASKPLLHLPCIAVLVCLSIPYNLAFIDTYAYDKKRMEGPDRLIEYLKQNNITRAYAHFTTAQSVSFESKKEIICADFGGFRNTDFLKLADESGRAAVITDKRLELPPPDIFEKELKTLTESYTRKEIGSYTVFHDFKFSPFLYNDVSACFIREKNDSAPDKNLLDRHFSTVWTKTASKEDSVVFNSQIPVTVSRVELVTGLNVTAFPKGIRVEGAINEGEWSVLSEIADYIPYFQKFNNNIRLLSNGHIDINFKGIPVRWLRISVSGENYWEISEIFIYEQNLFLRPDNKDALKLIGKTGFKGKLFLIPELIPAVLKQFPFLNCAALISPEALYRDSYLFWDYKERIINRFEKNGFLIQNTGVAALKKFFTDYHLSFSVEEFNGWSFVILDEVSGTGGNNSLMIPLTDRNVHKNPVSHEAEFVYRLKNKSLLKMIRVHLKNPLTFKAENLKVSVSDNGQNINISPLCFDEWVWADGFIARSNNTYLDVFFHEALYADTVVLSIPEKMQKHLPPLKTEALVLNYSESGSVSADLNSAKKNIYITDAVFDEKISIDEIEFSKKNLVPDEFIIVSLRGKCINKTALPFHVFIHFLNSENKLIFQVDFEINSDYCPVLEKNEPVLFEQMINIPAMHQNEKKIKVLLGICDSETQKRWKIKTKKTPCENRALIFYDFSS